MIMTDYLHIKDIHKDFSGLQVLTGVDSISSAGTSRLLRGRFFSRERICPGNPLMF